MRGRFRSLRCFVGFFILRRTPALCDSRLQSAFFVKVILDPVPYKIQRRHGQDRVKRKLPVIIGIDRNEHDPRNKHYRGHDHFPYSVRQRLYRKIEPPCDEIVLFHRSILQLPQEKVNKDRSERFYCSFSRFSRYVCGFTDPRAFLRRVYQLQKNKVGAYADSVSCFLQYVLPFTCNRNRRRIRSS